jgi:hypothetical protein
MVKLNTAEYSHGESIPDGIEIDLKHMPTTSSKNLYQNSPSVN